jgi:hypothetical protein
LVFVADDSDAAGRRTASKILPAATLGRWTLSTRFDAQFVPVPEQAEPV